MSISANTAQTRELTELRNHLKWLDEERRKSGRKMAELEQKLAQQGRELADRDQKIQELEWHVTNFAERFERLPDDANAASAEQRLQDLEWHLSNMNTQLTSRLPNMEEERARLMDEMNRALAVSREQTEADHSLLESRLRAEIAQVRESDVQRSLSQRQDEQTSAIGELQRQFDVLQQQTQTIEAIEQRYTGLQVQFQSVEELERKYAGLQEQLMAVDEIQRKHLALQENVALLSGQFRERTVSLAAESQANISSLAARLQEHLDSLSGEQQARLELLAADWQARLDALPTPEPGIDVTPELAALRERIAQLAETQQQWSLERAQLAETQQQWSLERAQLARELDGLHETLDPMQSRVLDLVALVDRATDLEENLALVRGNLVNAEKNITLVSGNLANVEEKITLVSGNLVNVEETVAKLGNVREVMPILDRLEQELELRQAEEVRLSALIGTQENRYAPLAAALEEVNQTTNALVSRLSEAERVVEEMRATVRDFNDNWKPAVTEANRRITSIAEKNTALSNSILKAEAGLQAVTGDQSELREAVTDLTDEIRRNQGDVARQLEGWQALLDENKDTIERFTQQWITLSNQYKEARMAVQNFAHWQKQLEQQKREASEMLRLESNRMQSRWDGFLLEIQEKLKNFELELNQKWQAFELENEQKWSSSRRNEQIRREELAAVDELIQKLQQDNRNLIWRVQAAQAEAIKKWPRLMMEEVEKAVELNPNRRLSATGTAPRADMSVVDAIEQGLITIDYNDDAAIDL